MSDSCEGWRKRAVGCSSSGGRGGGVCWLLLHATHKTKEADVVVSLLVRREGGYVANGSIKGGVTWS